MKNFKFKREYRIFEQEIGFFKADFHPGGLETVINPGVGEISQ